LEIHKYIYFKALKEVSALPLIFILLKFKENIKFLQIFRDGKCCDLYSALLTSTGTGARDREVSHCFEEKGSVMKNILNI
jgi:hypothetical protein